MKTVRHQSDRQCNGAGTEQGGGDDDADFECAVAEQRQIVGQQQADETVAEGAQSARPQKTRCVRIDAWWQK